ncbi:MAG: ABC transporter ATP-binding protein, partial [Curtobacterium sp.]
MTAAARIAFEDWGWRYPEREQWAVRGVDLVVEPGERVAVVGPSGAGKSTLLRAVAAVLPDEPDATDDTAAEVEGTLLVDGTDPRDARGRVGLVMQDPEAHTVMARIGDDVAFGCENLGVPREETWDRVATALEVVGLDLPLDRSTAQLSGGQRQRLALAGVLAMQPGALVLDEPCANLDPSGVAQVHDAVRVLLDATGATLLVVEHRIGTWLDLVDRLVLLEPGGGVVADGTPETVLALHGVALTAAGVWVPGAEPGRGSARHDRHGTPRELLRAARLGTARGRRQPVGRGIDLAVRSGHVVAVTGPNGIGKSTLGLTLAGLLRPTDGTLTAATELAGDAGIGTAPHAWSSRALAARIGTVFQDPEHQFVARTVREELAAGPRALDQDG